ncbi:hypothetical protein [Ferrimonas balearica]|uniref:hypothetical protein n=1 Tax=Ferrimonas balearica TaxID=44012 RepID=UPI001F19A153|nr:hypothetical protein [Ferrimonas balearica]MBY6016442.1 hypothetical protein [Halomonas denitrificans]MBY6095287.1 hypothetical protein [Ferrimonas balearica]
MFNIKTEFLLFGLIAGVVIGSNGETESTPVGPEIPAIETLDEYIAVYGATDAEHQFQVYMDVRLRQ